MSHLPPSPEHRARWQRARHWKARVLVLKHFAILATMLVVIAFLGVCYHALTIYGRGSGYRHGDIARVGIALFFGGGLVGWTLRAAWPGKGRE